MLPDGEMRTNEKVGSTVVKTTLNKKNGNGHITESFIINDIIVFVFKIRQIFIDF